MNGGTGGAGATTSGGMGATGTTTGGQPASGPGGSSAAGSSASGSSNLGGSGGVSTVTGPGGVTWSGYCVATFTSDYGVLDSFDEPLFTARVSEQYLMTAYPASIFGGPNSAELLYLTEDGPFEFEVDPGSDPPVFTANCRKGAATRVSAVFTDVSLYADSTLATKLCDLTAGTVLPLDGRYGYSLTSASDGEAIYSMLLGPYSAQCGAAEQGSVVVPLIDAQHLIPIRPILRPL